MDFKKALSDLEKCETKAEVWKIDDEVLTAAFRLIGGLKISNKNKDFLYDALEANRHAVRKGL